MANDTDRLEAQLAHAKEQLHRTLAEVNERAEAAGEQLQPEKLIERYSLPVLCAAGAAGFLLGAVDDNFLALGLMLAGGAIVLAGTSRSSS
ncbi:MAG TPA: hypothetical protein VMV13_03025 [Candidatus Binataceae bacterium]|nr:hypothetical protein [Candidatus Binataceae bacterium]